MHPTQTKEQARKLFFQSDLTRTQIAEITGISQRTLFDWIKEGDWLRARANAASAPALIAESYYNQLTALNKKIARRHGEAYATLEESTIIRRLAGTIKAVKPARNRNEAVELLAEFSRFVRRHNAAAADVLTDIMTAFLETINKPVSAPADEAMRLQEYEDYLKAVKREEEDRLADEKRAAHSRKVAERHQQRAEDLAREEERQWQEQEHTPPTATLPQEPLPEATPPPADDEPKAPQSAALVAPIRNPAGADEDSEAEAIPYYQQQLNTRARHERIMREANELLANYNRQSARQKDDADVQWDEAGYGMSG
jgi:hypothetical protein